MPTFYVKNVTSSSAKVLKPDGGSDTLAAGATLSYSSAGQYKLQESDGTNHLTINHSNDGDLGVSRNAGSVSNSTGDAKFVVAASQDLLAKALQ